MRRGAPRVEMHAAIYLLAAWASCTTAHGMNSTYMCPSCNQSTQCVPPSSSVNGAHAGGEIITESDCVAYCSDYVSDGNSICCSWSNSSQECKVFSKTSANWTRESVLVPSSSPSNVATICRLNAILSPDSSSEVVAEAACNEGFFFDWQIASSCRQCNASIGECLTCSNASTCTACKIGFFLKSGNSSMSSCVGREDCGAGSYPNALSSPHSCRRCNASISWCRVCSNVTTCSECDDGFFLKAKNSSMSSCVGREDCGAGSYPNALSSPHSCRRCNASISWCRVCSNVTTCSECDDGFFLKAKNSSMIMEFLQDQEKKVYLH